MTTKSKKPPLHAVGKPTGEGPREHHVPHEGGVCLKVGLEDGGDAEISFDENGVRLLVFSNGQIGTVTTIMMGPDHAHDIGQALQHAAQHAREMEPPEEAPEEEEAPPTN